ncbi:phosphoadenylyl-sulfate reductase [Massilia sp. TS11]|uniref:phosphoadenylyl-sulfate reductase n=1 Tax=Massilia sp. TS11 TaxID=2908003 RepID=UPI001EDB260D|nr:phosphoadenylyl-sulfate reductase [Massilia sp. TS11]MCG2586205.1 phosphoadenylyl-sulfate reductase [Massilia sp. TS11]
MSDLQARIDASTAVLRQVATEFSPAVFASSLAAEDMVLTDLILRNALPIGIFTLDTGRLHAETLAMLDTIATHYGQAISVYRPAPEAVEAYVSAHGLNAFYNSIALRHACCQVRKVEPLNRALQGQRAWITGQRRAQAVTRADLPVHEHDSARGMEKFNPLADWSEADVWNYIRAQGVPYNPLHDQGYPSIGCAPCTRAIEPGEDVRAGRWWWENPDQKECGLHLVDGKLIRIKQVSA